MVRSVTLSISMMRGITCWTAGAPSAGAAHDGPPPARTPAQAIPAARKTETGRRPPARLVSLAEGAGTVTVTPAA